MSKRKAKNLPVEIAAPSEIGAALDDPQEIQDAEQYEEAGGVSSGDDDADAEVLPNSGCGLTSSDIANRLLNECGAEFRFLSDRKITFAFKNGIWSPDTGDKHNLTHELFKQARRLCLRVYDESGAPRDKKAHLKSAHMPKAVASIANAELEHIKFAATFDRDPDLLGIPGGRVVELRTGLIRDAKPTDYVSKAATDTPDAAIKPERFLKFLDEISKSNPAWVAYMLRLLGYFLTGHVSEQYLGFWTGLTSNGKSVLVDLLTNMLGDYVAIISLKLLASGIGEDSEQELRTMAHLCGARVAFGSESSKKLKIDIGLAKKLSSQEKLLGRFLYENAFSFTPSHKLVVSAQELQFESIDYAIKRRLQVATFPQVFAEPKDAHRYTDSLPADSKLGAKLDRERPGILALLIDQARVWYEQGIDAPGVITEKTESFFVDADDFGQWLDASTARDSQAFTATNVLFASYTAFAQSMGREAMQLDAFAKKLKAAGFEDSRPRVSGRKTRGFSGLRLKNDDEDGAADAND